MTQTEIKGCIYLMSNLWTSYRPPQSELELKSAISAWIPFFGSIPEKRVTRAILEIAAEGGEFAPQIGQIYKHIKDDGRPRLKDGKCSEEFYRLCCLYADVAEIERPDMADNAALIDWFREVKSNGTDVAG